MQGFVPLSMLLGILSRNGPVLVDGIRSSIAGPTMVPVCMRRPTTPALYVAADGTTPHAATLANPFCVEATSQAL